MRKFMSVVVLASLAGCTERWPEDGREYIESRLDRGPSSLDCYRSHWNKEQGIEFPRPRVIEGSGCRFDPARTEWFANGTAVNAVSRCEGAGYTFEFSVTAFSRDHYYDGYFCQYAAAPKDVALPPLGEMTAQGTAMDGPFVPYRQFKKSTR